ncbi:hypothetical protein HRUBRA_00580 [Pseudohaliea rubra DSM 19751]|uniref:Transmembrane protein n=2 Tax=Pseudohaliea TaxID=1341120 RepID=A0A095VTP0_9GAMM|nr:hypothetical protein HRUBRA_00580 [Pseudohaliea rubra DSM 19751]
MGKTAPAFDRATVNRNRLVLLTIVGIPVTMILAATWLWYFVVNGELDLVGSLGTANNGELLAPPRPVTELGLVDQAGNAFTLASGEPKWTLLVPAPGACDASCERRLYLTRQIHVAMGKAFNRLQRAWVGDRPLADTAFSAEALSDGSAPPADFRAYLRTQHVGLLTLGADRAALRAQFPELADRPDTWYLVDPAGWVMMAYDDSVSYKDVMADLKFLLKNSNG